MKESAPDKIYLRIGPDDVEYRRVHVQPEQPKKLSHDDIVYATMDRQSEEINTNPWEERLFRPGRTSYHNVSFRTKERFRYAQEHMDEVRKLFGLEECHQLGFDWDHLIMSFQKEYHA